MARLPVMASPARWRAGPARAAALALVPVLGWVATGCGEEATPLDRTTTAQLTPHLLPSTDEMRELARQQCLDRPDLVQGEVNAVDPARPEQKLATVTVECAEVRAEAGDSSSGG